MDKKMPVLRVALLHLDPRPGKLEANRALIERSVRRAAALGADFIVTPELAESGYHFEDYIGTGWIGEESKAWIDHMSAVASDLGVTLLLSTAERDQATGHLHNTVFALTGAGKTAGRYRKVNIHESHTTESWARKGETADIIVLPQFKLGVMICADSWPPHIARELAEKGAELIISPANWGETPCPPESCWEKRSLETGLPVWVCNRTGTEHALNFEDAASVVVVGGKRLLNHCGPDSVILLFDWDLEKKTPLQTEFEVVPVT
ncbi:carbon-nitrogen hydrolase family protein [Dehalogenimonas alkenigignens]|nr:carbon-nitrogen hydrolase family protein [Dehalogenimonas alkenigignens]